MRVGGGERQREGMGQENRISVCKCPREGMGRGSPAVVPRYQAQEARVSFTKDSATLTQLRKSPLCM